jgi:hypothetical protein
VQLPFFAGQPFLEEFRHPLDSVVCPPLQRNATVASHGEDLCNKACVWQEQQAEELILATFLHPLTELPEVAEVLGDVKICKCAMMTVL